MAKIKRVLRKISPHGESSFDEQLWPVNLALMVLGSFLIGIVFSYLRFDDARWYANAWTSLALIPLVIGGAMLALRYVSNRVVRRAVQFSAVISLLIHLLFMVVALRTHLFGELDDKKKVAKHLVPPSKRVAMPDYQKHQLIDPDKRPKMEFEKPVETKLPDAEPERMERPENTPDPQPEQQKTTVEPEPVPKETAQPNTTKKQIPSETVPRQSEQQSKLSRAVTKTQPRPNQAADSPQVTKQAESPTPTPKLDAQASSVSRQSPNAQVNTKVTEVAPTTNTPQPTAQLSRRDPQQTPQPQTSAKPTLQRQVNQPAVVPKAQVQTDVAPAVAKKTDPAVLTPQTTNTTKQETTAAPQVAQKTTEPTPDTPTKPAAKPERRQHESEARPTVAQTPTPVPNQRTRMTLRPETATAASTANPSPTPSQNSTPSLTAQNSSVNKRSNEAAVEKRAPSSEPTPNTPSQQQVASLTRREAEPSPTAQPTAVAQPSMSRQSGRPTVAPATTAAASSPTAVARQTNNSDVSATSVATRKQTIDSPQVAKAVGEPSPATGPKSNAALPSPTAAKQQTAQAGPQVGSAKNAVPGKTTATKVGNVRTNVADVATNAAPTQSSDFNPQPSTSNVARQSNAPSASASRAQNVLDAPQASTSNQIAQGSAQRAVSMSLPSLNVPSGSTSATARATRTATAAASPTNVESPALAAAAQGSGDSSSQPARMALSKSLAGIAGAGRSPNLDRSTPNSESPALVASGSAQRAKATQSTPDGAAFSPSAPAVVSRSIAGAERPSSSFKAEQVEVATTGGSATPTEINASSSAALTQANANASPGATTAAKGNVEIDLGPTQIVSDTGSGRSAGGGQPELNFETGSQQIARQKAGGAPQMSIAAAVVAALPQAPAGGQAGAAPAVEMNSVATATVRSEAGGNSPASGGPSAAEKGAPAEINSAPLLADASVSRADNSQAAAGGGAGGLPQVSEQSNEEKGRRLARSASGGAPTVALAAPVIAEAPTSEKGDGEAKEAMLFSNATSTATAKADLGKGIPGAASGPAAVETEVGEAASGGGGEVAARTTITRAEAVDAAIGSPVAGGGTNSPSRAAAGREFTANTQADTVTIASAPASGGEAQGVPFEATGLAAAKTASGAPGAATNGPVGAAAGDVAVDSPAGQIAGTAIGQRQSSAGEGDSPSTTASVNNGAPLKRAEQGGPAAGVASNNVVEIPQVAAMIAQADDDHLGGAMAKGSVSRRAAGSLSVELALADGPGGFSRDLTPDVGIMKRPASSESVDVQLQASRFKRQAVGGLPSVSTAAIVSSEMFQRRIDRAKGKKDAGGGGAEPQTEDAIELGLQFLVRNQSPDGSWSLQGFGETAALTSDTAATALSTLAFLGAGYHHREFKYKDAVRSALDYLIKNQRPDGDLFVPLDDESNRSVRLYSHAIATMALCEALLCTNDDSLREPAQKAIDFIVASQHKEQGGWRYTPGISADTSVTGWMIVALKYGRDAGLKIPNETFTKVHRWVDAAQVGPTEKHMYRYNPYAPDTDAQRHGRLATKTMTAVGLVMRIYLGAKADSSDLVQGASYLEQHLPSNGTQREPERDTYYWYYSTLFMHYMGGEAWENWNKALHPLLTGSQIKDGQFAGSWDPATPIPDRWSYHAGRLYVTTMNLLSLEVRWRGLRQSDNATK